MSSNTLIRKSGPIWTNHWESIAYWQESEQRVASKLRGGDYRFWFVPNTVGDSGVSHNTRKIL